MKARKDAHQIQVGGHPWEGGGSAWKGIKRASTVPVMFFLFKNEADKAKS